jgi:ATP-binding protein involved in chromosome partitioning
MRIFSDFQTDSAARPPIDIAYVRERIRANLSGVGATIALASASGGVGKSVLAVNIATALALKGKKVALVDADLNSPSIAPMLGMKPQRNFPMVEGIEPAAGPHGLRIVSSAQLTGGEAPAISFAQNHDQDFDLVDGQDGQVDGHADGQVIAPAPETPAVLSYSEGLNRIFSQTQFGNVDLLIIDLATGLDRLRSVAAMVSLDGVLLCSHPSEHASHAARHAIQIASAIGAPIVGIVENMIGFNCDGCRSVRPLWPEGDLHGVAREHKVPIIARLAFEPRLADSTDRGVPFVREYASTPTAKHLIDIASQLETMLATRARPAVTSA